MLSSIPYYETQRSMPGAYACVVRRRVRRREVLAHFNKRGEDEVVLFSDSSTGWTIDGATTTRKPRRPSGRMQRDWKVLAETWRKEQPDW